MNVKADEGRKVGKRYLPACLLTGTFLIALKGPGERERKKTSKKNDGAHWGDRWPSEDKVSHWVREREETSKWAWGGGEKGNKWRWPVHPPQHTDTIAPSDSGSSGAEQQPEQQAGRQAAKTGSRDCLFSALSSSHSPSSQHCFSLSLSLFLSLCNKVTIVRCLTLKTLLAKHTHTHAQRQRNRQRLRLKKPGAPMLGQGFSLCVSVFYSHWRQLLLISLLLSLAGQFFSFLFPSRLPKPPYLSFGP